MIRLVELRKTFGDKVILKCASLHFNPGERYGLVGANGAGKTTLLKMITGDEHHDSGEITVPKDCVIAHLPQYPNPSPLENITLECMSGDKILFEKLQKVNRLALNLSESYSAELQEEFEQTETDCRHAGGYVLESAARELLSGLGFTTSDFTRSPLEFSGGWRMRLELAKILLQSPGVLVLDEPTNHLDLPSIAWLERRLATFTGTLIYVSHDRSLLNRLSTRTLHIKGGLLREYVGGFDQFLEQMEMAVAGASREREKVASQAQKLEDFATRFGAKATMASRAKSKLKMAEKLRALEDELSDTLDDSAAVKEVHITIPEAPSSPRAVIRFEQLVIGYSKPLFQPFSAVIERGSRVAIIGANGAGKSTLLRTLMRECSPMSGDFVFGENVVTSYFAQEQAEVLDLSKTVLESVLSANALIDEKKARSLLGSLKFSGSDVNKRVSVLSGGETNRVGLACMLTGKANLLILDEPTNHLDMSSVDNLAAALGAFGGTVVFVSHNREFIDDVCTHILAVTRDGQIGIFEGNLEDYARACAISGFPNVLLFGTSEPSTLGKGVSGSTRSTETHQGLEVSLEGTRQSWEGSKGVKRERAKLRKEIDKLDVRLRELEQFRLMLTEKMNHPEKTDYAAMSLLASNVSSVNREIEELEEQWLSLNETLESLQSDEN